MSMMISYCLIVKAAEGDEEAYQSLLSATKYNMSYGHFTQRGCFCDPTCDTTDEKLKLLNERIALDTKDLKIKNIYSLNINIIGTLDSEDELPKKSNHLDAYLIGENLYIWNKDFWENVGTKRP